MRAENTNRRWGSRHMVAADVIRALGKGFLIACAGVVVGLLIGTSQLGPERVLTLLTVGTMGAACMGTAAFLRDWGSGETDKETLEEKSGVCDLQIEPAYCRQPSLCCEPSDNPAISFIERLERREANRYLPEDRTEEDRAVTRYVQEIEMERLQESMRQRGK